jgi:hypothetical protein
VSHPPEVQARVEYNNHPAVNYNASEVEAKFAAEEAKSFHIIFPKFLTFFIIGLFLNPLQWAIRKGKGRICVDCTNGPNPIGSPNTYINPPSPKNADECPPVYYGSSFQRFLIMLWCMRLAVPLSDILMHCDDLDAAFRRVLYHPDLAVVFAYVFLDFLIVPVGQVFGSRSAPSYFSLLSDIRANVASTADLVEPEAPLEDLAVAADIEALPPEWDPTLSLTPACPDALHLPLTASELCLFLNATFVDDNAIAAFRPDIRVALHQSIRSALLLFGFPVDDRRTSCINADKWDEFVSHVMLFLGFLIDSRAMTVTWTLEKRLELRDQIKDLLANTSRAIPKAVASVIGKIRSAAQIAPWGNHLPQSVQDALTFALRKAASKPRWFWKDSTMRIPAEGIRDLATMLEPLALPEFDPTWTRPIALLIPRTPTESFLSDASYGGLGGWSPKFHVKWRVMRYTLLEFGFDMRAIDAAGEPADLVSTGLHINPLEFIANIINVWLALKLMATEPSRATGFIIALLSDNTSGLAWMRSAGKVRDLVVCRLARLASSFLVKACSLTALFQPQHIPGKENDEADCLSLLVNGLVPSWDYVIKQCSRLSTCRLCLLPRELLSTLAAVLSSPLTEETYDNVTTHLLMLELDILLLGLRPVDLQSTVS